jgi:hypothetical protein
MDSAVFELPGVEGGGVTGEAGEVVEVVEASEEGLAGVKALLPCPLEAAVVADECARGGSRKAGLVGEVEEVAQVCEVIVDGGDLLLPRGEGKETDGLPDALLGGVDGVRGAGGIVAVGEGVGIIKLAASPEGLLKRRRREGNSHKKCGAPHARGEAEIC